MSNLPKTRSDAKTIRSTQYFTGKPCIHGHTSSRRTSTGHCTKCCVRRVIRYKHRNRDKHNAWAKEKSPKWRADLKLLVMSQYSKGIPQCSCCGEKEIVFLTMDHIDGGGNNHRRTIGRGSGRLYKWLKKNNFPKGYQVLCFNCNLGKHILGACPHQLKGELKCL